MTGRTVRWLALVAIVSLVGWWSWSCKKSDPKGPIKKFHTEFAQVHQEGVRQGFFGCLYGSENLPSQAKEFIEKIKVRFDSDPEGFITEKSEGCAANLEQTIEKVRLMVAPTTEIGSARDAYSDAADAMITAWGVVHQAFLDYKQVDDTRIEFNGTYAPLLKTAGDQGWALLQKCQMLCAPSEAPPAPPAGQPAAPPAADQPPPCTKDNTVDECLARIGAGDPERKNAYRYLDFMVCILKSYDVDVGSLLVHDTKAVEEGRGYLMGVKLLRDKLTELCTGEYGQPTNILEWGKRVSAQCYPLLELADPAKPELLEEMVTWWSSDGVRVGGEAYSSYAVLADVCVKQTIDLEPPLKEFLKSYAAFAAAASALDDAIAAAEK
ncbi:MAG: hypothetical protein HY907_22560 [Deltaproteobacteria bacterium]|nr:hypothetical protein [Deltaproteobacteria bacterium]